MLPQTICQSVFTAQILQNSQRNLRYSLAIWLTLLLALLVSPSVASAEAVKFPDVPTYFSSDGDHTNSIDWGDYDNDGDLDLATGNGLLTWEFSYKCDIDGNGTNFNKLYENIDGVIQKVPIWTSPDRGITSSVEWGDMDGDGDLDLAVGNCEHPNQVYLNQHGVLAATPAWSAAISERTFSVTWGDVNGDGFLDLAVGNDGQPTRIYFNRNGMLETTATWNGVTNDHTRSLAWGDMDGDGDLDLAVGNVCNLITRCHQDNIGNQSKIYRNENKSLLLEPVWRSLPNADGRFDNTRSVAWGDVNGDGYLDLAVGNESFYVDDTNYQFISNKVYLNQNGMVQTTPAWDEGVVASTFDVAWGDADGDGDLDLAVGDLVTKIYRNNNGVLETSADAHWESKLNPSARDLAWGDFDRDGDLDLAVAMTFRSPNRLYLNQEVQFYLAWESPDINVTYMAVWADMDKDGDLDLVLGNAGPDKIFYNDRGSLRQEGYQFSSDNDETISLTVGDIDGNGYLDIIAGNNIRECNAQQNKIYLFDANGWWQTRKIGIPKCTSSVALGDVDGDGDLDLLVGHNQYLQNELYLNDGKANFVKSSWNPPALRTVGVAWGDVDRDGDLDLAVVNGGDWNEIYLNQDGMLQDQPYWISADTGICGYPFWGDMNGDGYPDLAVTCWNAPNKVYLNEQGTLTRFAAWIATDSYYSRNAAWADADGDGDGDFAIANSEDLEPRPDRIYFNEKHTLNPTGSEMKKNPLWDSTDMAFGDIDGDGDLDLVTTILFDPDRSDPLRDRDKVYINRQRGGVQYEPFDHKPSVAVTAPQSTGVADLYSTPEIIADPLIPISFSLSDPDGDMVRQIIASYSLDGGDHWQPAIAASNTATTNLATLSSVGGALDFDGTDDYVALPALNTNYVQGLTLEAWVFFDDFKNWSRIIEMGNGRDNDNILFANRGTSNDLSLHIYKGSQHFEINAPNALERGVWHHLVATIDSSGNAKLYRDGVVIQTGSLPPPNLVMRTQNYIGRSNWTTDQYFDGMIKDLRIWNIARTESEIQANLHQPLSGNEPGLIANWLLNEGRGAFIFDQGSNHLPTQLGGGVSSQRPTWEKRTTQHIFTWDTFRSGLFGQSDNVVFRIEAYAQPVPTDIVGTYLYTNSVAPNTQWVYAASTTFPFRVRGAQVRVLDQNQNAISNAKIYRLPAGHTDNGTLMGNGSKFYRTNHLGYLEGRGALYPNDQLFAILPVTVTDKYTLYYTSGLAPHTVQAGGVQTLTVSSANPLILFDITVSLEWDATKDEDFLPQLTENLKRASRSLYDWSDGQIALGNVTVYHAKAHWQEADVQILASNQIRPNAARGGIVTQVLTLPFHKPNQPPAIIAPGEIHMPPLWNRYGESTIIADDWSHTLAHELAHHLLYLEDSYLGLDEDNLLSAISTCADTAMTDPYLELFSEFRNDLDWQQPDSVWQRLCGQALTELPDWAIITHFYPDLHRPTVVNPGPDTMPFALTQVTIQPAPALLTPLVDDMVVQLVSAYPVLGARAYLIKPGQRLIDLGRPVGTSLLARGAQLGDEVCIFAQGLFGCALYTNASPLLITMQPTSWQPQLRLTPVTTTTVEILVQDQEGQPLTIQLYADGEFDRTIELVSGMPTVIPFTKLMRSVFIDLSGDRSNGERLITGYTIGDGPGRTWSHDTFTSGDGGVSLFPPQEMKENDIVVIQTATSLSQFPPGLLPIGRAYDIRSTLTGQFTKGSISFQYLGQDVLLSGQPEESLAIHYWDGHQWQRLTTKLNLDRNVASAPFPAPGIYVLTVGSVKLNIHKVEPASAMAGQAHIITITAPITDIGAYFQAPLDVILQSNIAAYTLTTLSLTPQQIVVATPADLPADEYNLTIHHAGSETVTQPAAFALYTAQSTTTCFLDDFQSGLGKWKTSGEWGIVTLSDGLRAVTDSPEHPYRSANSGERLGTTITMRTPINLAECLNVNTDSLLTPIVDLRYDYQLMPNDSIQLEVSIDEGTTWHTLRTFQGTAMSEAATIVDSEWKEVQWKLQTLSLRDFSTATTAYLRLHLVVDDFGSAKGWLMDEIAVNLVQVHEDNSQNNLFLPLVMYIP